MFVYVNKIRIYMLHTYKIFLYNTFFITILLIFCFYQLSKAYLVKNN